MLIPTEPIGSTPRPASLDDAGSYLRRALQLAHVPIKQAVISPSLAGEDDPVRVLRSIREHLRPHQQVLFGVVVPIDPRIETPEEVRDRILLASTHIPADQLGSTDDCGFAPLCDDVSTTRDTAFAKIQARVAGSEHAAVAIGGRGA